MWPFLETTEGPIHLRAAQNVTEWAAPRNDFPSTNTLFVIFASFVGVAYSASFVASAASWLLALLLQGVSSLLLGVMVIMAYLDSAGHVFFDDMDSDKPVESQDREFLVSSEVRDFAEHAGLQYEEHHVETKDGYILVLQRVYEATAKTSKSFIPVICQHGVLQRGGTAQMYSHFFYSPSQVFTLLAKKTALLSLLQGMDLMCGLAIVVAYSPCTRISAPETARIGTGHWMNWDFTMCRPLFLMSSNKRTRKWFTLAILKVSSRVGVCTYI